VQVGVEYVEFVALNYFWRGVLTVIVHLVVLVPLETLLHRVEITRLARNIRDLILLMLSFLSIGQAVNKLNFVLLETLILYFLEQLERRVVKTFLIYNVKSDSSVQRSLFYFLC
jgi:hypothetical protein